MEFSFINNKNTSKITFDIYFSRLNLIKNFLKNIYVSLVANINNKKIIEHNTIVILEKKMNDLISLVNSYMYEN